MITLSGGKIMQAEIKKKEEEKNSAFSGQIVL
jgi:hypothetical protein